MHRLFPTQKPACHCAERGVPKKRGFEKRKKVVLLLLSYGLLTWKNAKKRGVQQQTLSVGH